MDERLLELYNLELRHLRETAAEFGRDFPKSPGACRWTGMPRRFAPTPMWSGCWRGSPFWRRGCI